MKKVIQLLETIQEKYASRNLVNDLCKKDVSDYDRGMIAGEIKMLTHIMMELAANDKNS
jgi:hypothetical protein